MSDPGLIIAVEGVHADALTAAAETVAGRCGGGISFWDASGVFAELAVTEEAAGRPSVRTLLLLYASDLAHRLRTEVLPIIDAGGNVVVAPYLETALAFSRVGGVDSQWISEIFAFAPPPSTRYYAPAHAGVRSERQGFVELGARKLNGHGKIDTFVSETDRHLRGLARLTGAARI